MPASTVVIPQLEGYLGTLVNSGVTGGPSVLQTEPVFEWINVVKRLMRQPLTRDLTDWNMFATGSVIKTSATNVVYTGVSTLYAILFGSINTAKAQWEAIYDHAAKTFDATAALDALTRGLVYQPAAASASAREYMGVVWEQGIPFATAISIAAEGFDGTDTSANDVSAVVIYRTS